MKAQDLMIGDWVYIHHGGKATHYGKVTALLPSGAIESEIDGSHALSSSVEPIPITPEILEKNGFHFTKADRMSLTDRYVLGVKGTRDGAIVEITFYNPDAHGVKVLTKIHTQSSHESGINSVHSCDIESVHELQRALRLCKIDKTIEL